jgi:hypothetical protein
MTVVCVIAAVASMIAIALFSVARVLGGLTANVRALDELLASLGSLYERWQTRPWKSPSRADVAPASRQRRDLHDVVGGVESREVVIGEAPRAVVDRDRDREMVEH